MKILAFTFEAPNRRYGGGIGIMQSLASLCSFADVTSHKKARCVAATGFEESVSEY